MTNKELHELEKLIFEVELTYLKYGNASRMFLDANNLKNDGFDVDLENLKECLDRAKDYSIEAEYELIRFVRDLVRKREKENGKIKIYK